MLVSGVSLQVSCFSVSNSAVPIVTFYFSGFGGPLFWMAYFGFMTLDQVTFNFQVWFFGYWARQYEDRSASGVDARWYLTGYMVVFLASLLFTSLGLVVYLIGSLRASRITHEKLIFSVLHAPLRWLDSTPSGRIIARFTQDINATDSECTRHSYYSRPHI